MKSVVRPELPTAAAGSSQAPTAPVDNSAPRSTHPEPTYKSGKTVQITGTTSEGGMIVANITEEIARLKDAAEWKSGDRLAVSLVKNDALNVLLMVLEKGAQLHEHRTKGPIVLQLVSGAIRFVAESNERSLSTGEMVALDRGIAHSVKALEESTLLLVTAIK